jgi:dynein light intermediate chain 1, cytosolic
MAGTAAAGIVGPLGSSSFSLPTVERALTEMEVGISGSPTGSGEAARRAAARLSGRPAGVTTLAPSTTSTIDRGTGRQPTSPALSSMAPSPTGTGQSQHEVLQNFFQSLLSSKDRGGGSPTATRSAASKSNGTGNGNEEKA